MRVDPAPDNALIRVLCEAARCSREACELAPTDCEHRWHPASEPPSSTDAEWVAVADKTWFVRVISKPAYWPKDAVLWYPIPPVPEPEPDDGFQAYWDSLPRVPGEETDYRFRLIDGESYHIAPVYKGWKAALAAQKGKA